jgi:hypothetical protein
MKNWMGKIETMRLNDDGDLVPCEPQIELDGKFTAQQLRELAKRLDEEEET